ncbi:MAG: heavy metal translocating P-type ATPase, partial [Coriobacteriales bacterium]
IRMVINVVKAVPYLISAVKSLVRGRVDVHVLDAASITVAMVKGDFDTAGSVMFLLGVGDIMEEWTYQKSVGDLANAMSLQVDKVWVQEAPDSEQAVLANVNDVEVGSFVVVRTGNMIPLDGIVASGEAMVNQASITGEPIAVRKKEGGTIFAGTVIEEGELVVRVTKRSGTGQYDRIVAMIEESEKLGSSSEKQASTLADKLVPWTFATSALAYLFTRDAVKAYSVLMVDFCCALKLTMPLSVLSAMREASLHGIRVKSGRSMERFAEAETIVFDKTGTLTKATPEVHGVIPFDGNDEREMLRLAACLEEHYPHSIASAVVQAAKDRGLTHEEKHAKVQYVVAHGIASSVDGEKVCIGSSHYVFEDEGAVIPQDEQEKFDALPDAYSHLYLAIGGRLSAVLLIEDPLKEGAARTVARLHDSGFSRVVMLTGDTDKTARAIAARLGIDEYHAEVLPEDKARFIEEEHAAGRKVVMVRDGVNDSPALSAADTSVAITSGAAIAREIADITIAENDLDTLVTLSRLCNGLMGRIRSNYRKIIGFNSLLIALGIAEVVTPTTTALLHNTSTIIFSLQSMKNLLPETK